MADDLPSLTADCTRCVGLCCVALHFDKGAYFAEDKPAGRPCRHLGDDNLCTIHHDLSQKGYEGCVRFDCHGAGQRVTGLFDEDWRAGAQVMNDMTRAFGLMLRVHEALLLLKTAENLPLPAAEEQRRQDLLTALTLPADAVKARAALPHLRPEKARIWLRGLAKNLPPDVAQTLAADAQAT
ncbi:hypothetical protein ACMU_17485 [Actibacterium mucosum KCTC 23349]|uniref:Pentapeptide repeat-containing protein n=1 Tax=Actibacterium mucosum KCTC 23349 TaxID=1454373 RepID=A0A037ZG48_9RHOB|nr:hypothetical protein [Actibacterium mucosum]KAJ54501.1 hypothetical protein ACMU_17485 [Actibacterium mucosum KCTC 23349]